MLDSQESPTSSRACLHSQRWKWESLGVLGVGVYIGSPHCSVSQKTVSPLSVLGALLAWTGKVLLVPFLILEMSSHQESLILLASRKRWSLFRQLPLHTHTVLSVI